MRQIELYHQKTATDTQIFDHYSLAPCTLTTVGTLSGTQKTTKLLCYEN